MTRAWDVLVVGAGPAGSVAARVVADAGYSVVIVDRKRVVGEPNHCGEAVSEQCLEEAGFSAPQAWIRRSVPGCRVIFPSLTRIHFPKRGFCIDRPAFDRALAERAAEAGASIRPGLGVREVSRRSEGWVVDTAGGSLSASYLVGAGGALCPVARSFGDQPSAISGTQYKFRAADVPAAHRDGWLRFYHHQDFPGGYGWLFPRGEEVSVGVGSAARPKPGLGRLCGRLGLDPSRRLSAEGGAIPFPERPPQLVHGRAVLCGDAGGFVAPLTKGGVLGAVWSGRLAGETLVETLEADDPGRLRLYEQRVADHPSRDPRQLRLPHALCGFDNEILDSVGRIMDDLVYDEAPVMRGLRELVLRPGRHTWWGISVALRVQRAYLRSERFAW